MKTTQTSQPQPQRTAAAAARATQRRRVPVAPSGIAAGIGASPRVVAQRAQLEAAFGPALQRQGPEEEELQAKAAPGVLQRQEKEDLQATAADGGPAIAQLMALSNTNVAGVFPTGGKKKLVDDPRQAEVYSAPVEPDENRLEALTSSAGVNAEIGNSVRGLGKKWTPPRTRSGKNAIPLPTDTRRPTLDPFILETHGSYGEDPDQKNLIISYQHALKFQGYVTAISDAGAGGAMSRTQHVRKAERTTKYGHQHESEASKLIDLTQPGKDTFEKWDVYTKIAGEGARWQCVRAHAAALQDDSVFYTKAGNPGQDSVWGVTFKKLWTTWKQSFDKAYNIPNAEVVDKLKTNTLENQSGRKVRVKKSDSALRDGIDYNLDAGAPAKKMEWVEGT